MSQIILERKKDIKNRIAWGSCRVPILAHFITIQEKLDAAWPLTTIHEQLKDSLPGVSYTQFVYHIRKRIPSTSKRRRSTNTTTSVIQSPPVGSSGSQKEPKVVLDRFDPKRYF